MSLFITEHTPNFSTAGQITSENISEIAGLGYRTIIGNRPDLEGGSEQPMQADIEKAALAVGLHFAYLSVGKLRVIKCLKWPLFWRSYRSPSWLIAEVALVLLIYFI